MAPNVTWYNKESVEAYNKEQLRQKWLETKQSYYESLRRREQVINFGYLPPENKFNFKKKEFLCPESFCSTQNWPPHVNVSNFQAEENVFILKIFGTSRWEKSSSNPPPLPPDWSILLKLVRTCLKDKN